MKNHWLILSVAFLASGAWGVVQANEPGTDLPFLQRYAGSTMKEYATRRYDEVHMPLGPFKKVGEDAVPVHSQALEGQVIYIVYRSPVDRSSLEIMSNYRQALQREGFQVLWQCTKEQCSSGDPSVSSHDAVWTSSGDGLDSFFANAGDGRMLTARLDSANGVQTWAYLWVEGPDNLNREGGETKIYAVQTQPMQTGLVQGSTEMLSAAAMGQALGQQGRFAMHLPFDFNKATLRPDAMAQVRQLAQVLQSHPTWRVGLDGHTDAVGSPEVNQKLSADRAAAVKSALVSLGVSALQVATRGLGATQPVASNATTEGRAQNRRVEVVNLTPGFVPAMANGAVAASPSRVATQAPAMTGAPRQVSPGVAQQNPSNIPEPVKDAAQTAGDAARSEMNYQIYRGVSNLFEGLFH
ncbi:OmpA family protein [Acidithiobacillus sp. M4-SHS-6]|uniref:OmpA family protein n=1 Tax=Acidithiobacillus sp. M4-SHS-6 TaxID=3383024 RepID=UPI0039BE3ACF